MKEISLNPFADPRGHEAVSKIIRSRSNNRNEFRECLLGRLELSGVHDVLDLGCGFGFMAEAIATHCAPDARFLGIDAVAANERPYMERIGATGRQVEFRRYGLKSEIPAADRSFDLVLCSYSLYFFPEILADAARVLRPSGFLVAVTHSENDFRSLLRAAGRPHEASTLLSIIRRFSAENAEEQLSRHFRETERIDYPNSLRFGSDHYEDLLTYVKFKLPYIAPEAQTGEIPEVVLKSLTDWLDTYGEVVIEKDDYGFISRGPHCL